MEYQPCKEIETNFHQGHPSNTILFDAVGIETTEHLTKS